MGARSRFACVIVSVSVSGWASGCTTFGEGDADGGTSDAGAPDGATADAMGATDSSDTGLGDWPCSGTVFCDDFESGTLTAKWPSPPFTSTDTVVELVPGIGLGGSAGLRVIASGAQGPQQGLLLLERNDPKGAYTVRMGFAANVSEQTANLSGPRVLVESGSGGQRRDLFVQFQPPESVRLSDYKPDCAECGNAPTEVVAVGGGWHRYRVEIVVTSASKPYGTVALEIDGTVRIKSALWMPIAAPSRLKLSFGLTSAPTGARGTLVFDEVYFDVF